jgi:hypothetical protein
MSKVIQFNYLYRDAGNYKQRGSALFTNPKKLGIKEIEQQLRLHFEQRELFIAHQIGLSELFFYIKEPITEDDHCYHEFASVTEIKTVEPEPRNRSISDFLTDVQAAASVGWKVFSPEDRLPEIRATAENP